eukprot:gnl/TRDRNA2_/TRDRNA2_177112_c2_seq4.p1 gnl/TRDRNA2_/TRDRNA2_177112_c2~~gnl/TRDRNA2_/TRDRNA2_177112_c2_seq4.p1  ORF type:complete len:188 (-),score=24.55 gnl/TRDRNA2_/TRDRNA2_177112_c2_seq4:380-943(-)
MFMEPKDDVQLAVMDALDACSFFDDELVAIRASTVTNIPLFTKALKSTLLQQQQHEAGTCKPCIYHMFSAKGCILADTCEYCHQPHHRGQGLSRTSKKNRDSVKRRSDNTMGTQPSTQASQTAPVKHDAESLDDSAAQVVDMNECSRMQMRQDDDSRTSADPVFTYPTQCNGWQSRSILSATTRIRL